MLWLEKIVDHSRCDLRDSLNARDVVINDRPLFTNALNHHHTEKDGEEEHYISFSIGNNVYFVDGETTHVFRVGHYTKGKRFVSDNIVFMGLLPESLAFTTQALSAKFLSETINPEKTRRPEKLNLISAFRQVHNLDNSQFDTIDVRECWIFQKRLKEAAQLLNISMEEDPAQQPLPHQAPCC